MNEHLHSISFKILDDEEIENLSVFNAQQALENKQAPKEVLQDARLGGSNAFSYCATCNLKGGQCLGHESKLKLALPVLNPGCKNILKAFLKFYCFNCKNFNYLEKKKCSVCVGPRPSVSVINAYTFYVKNELVKIDLLYQDLLKIPEEQTKPFFKNSKTSVRNFFITSLIIPSVTIRPNVVFQERLYEDDITKKLETILQVNQKLAQMLKVDLQKAGVLEMHRLLQYHIFTYFDNKTPRIPTAIYKNGAPLKSLLEKIDSKEGIFRSNLAGKRTDFAMRAVLTADSSIGVDQIGISESLAALLTKPVVITQNNIEKAKEWIDSKVYVTATYYEYHTQEGSFLKLKITDSNKEFIKENLSVGSIIHRSLMTGDRVVFNRQPTLHRYGIMAHSLVVYEDHQNDGRTIRLNPSSCPSYNADFDGDEGNLMPPKSKESEIDMTLLMSVKANLIDTKKGTPIIGLTKELLTAAYGLSNSTRSYSRATVVDLFGPYLNNVDLEEKETYSAKEIISAMLPKGFNFQDNKKNGIVIKDGQFISGIITKSNFSNSSVLMCQLAAYLGEEKYWTYLTCMLQVFRSYYKYLKQSISYDDYLLFVEPTDQEDDKFDTTKDQAQKIEEVNKTFIDLDRTEIIENPVLTMTSAGSSGSLIGISQITKAVGQKKIRYEELGTFFKNCYPNYTVNKKPTELSEADLLQKGYIKNNYLNGLTFSEYIVDATHARDTNLDNQLNVSTIGYFNRRVTNALADVISVKEGFLEDGSRNIIQYSLGGCGADLITYKPNVLTEELVNKLDILTKKETSDYKVITIENIETVLNNTYGKNSNKKSILYTNFKPHHRLTIPQLIEMGDYISTPVGAPVGITTAHAYGEPATQMTLNAKHDVTGLQSRFSRLLELTERMLTKPKVLITTKNAETLRKIKNYVGPQKLSSLITLAWAQKSNQIVLLGDLKLITSRILLYIKLLLKDYQMLKVMSGKTISSYVFTHKTKSKPEIYKDYLNLKSLEYMPKKGTYLEIDDKSCYVQGNKGSVTLYSAMEKLKTVFKDIDIVYFDPLYYEKIHGVEAGRKLLYEEFTKFVNEGLDIDSRYFSLFCDLVTTRGLLLPLGRNGVLNHKPPLAKLSYEAAKSGIFELAVTNRKDYLKNPYSCLITNTPLKIGADYFEINL